MYGDPVSKEVSQDASHCAPVIGYHRAPLSQKFGAPRQPNLVALSSVIEMVAPYDTKAAFEGLDEFSHIWISWQFHHNRVRTDEVVGSRQGSDHFRPQVRPPRLGGNQKIGVFASRSMYRPSALGLSVVKLEGIDIIQGRVLLRISGADMIDGTPIIDIKPYVAYSDAITQATRGFAPTAPALLDVVVTPSAYEQFLQVIAHQGDSSEKDAATIKAFIYQIQHHVQISDLDAIKALIAQDPRPAYRRTARHQVFTMRYKSVDVSFQLIASGQLQIVRIVEVH